MIFEYKGPGAPKGIPAQATGAELQRIYSQRGELSPSAIVDESRAPGALLHSAFEWDDEEAAERFREVQARQIVRSVVLVSQPEHNEMAPMIRAFVSLSAPTADGPARRVYKPTMEALTNPLEADEIKRRLRHELLALRRRYMDLLEVDEIVNAIQQAFSEVA